MPCAAERPGPEHSDAAHHQPQGALLPLPPGPPQAARRPGPDPGCLAHPVWQVVRALPPPV
jgi:hypothetical protein